MSKHEWFAAGSKILVKLEKVEELSKGGIVLSGHTSLAQKRAAQKATVVHIGQNAFTGYKDETPWCKVGDKVFICKYSGEDLLDIEPDEIYRVIQDEDILAVHSKRNMK